MGRSEPGGARVQAASLSPEICIVVDRKDNFPFPGEGKPTPFMQRKAEVLAHAKTSGEDTTGV